MDSDQYLDVQPLEQPYVLTSMIKKFDVAVYELVHMLVDGDLRPGVSELGLAENAVGYSTTGSHLSIDTIAALERYRQEIVAGTRVVPSAPTGPLEPPLGATVTTTLTVTFDGSTCSYEGPRRLEPGIVRVEFVNNSDRDGWLDVTRGSEFSAKFRQRRAHRTPATQGSRSERAMPSNAIRGREPRSPDPRSRSATSESCWHLQDDPHAEQANRTQLAESGEHGRRHGGDLVRVGRRRGELADLGAGEEGRRAHLHGDVSDPAAVGDHLSRDLAGQPLDVGGDRRRRRRRRS